MRARGQRGEERRGEERGGGEMGEAVEVESRQGKCGAEGK